MKITDVQVRKILTENSKLKAVASITIDDCFAVHDIKIIDGPNGLFIAMPSRKIGDGEYKDVAHPTNTETRNEIINLILDKYNEVNE